MRLLRQAKPRRTRSFLETRVPWLDAGLRQDPVLARLAVRFIRFSQRWYGAKRKT